MADNQELVRSWNNYWRKRVLVHPELGSGYEHIHNAYFAGVMAMASINARQLIDVSAHAREMLAQAFDDDGEDT